MASNHHGCRMQAAADWTKIMLKADAANSSAKA